MFWLCSFTSSQLKERDTIKMIVHLNDKQENLKRHEPITHPSSDSLWAFMSSVLEGRCNLWFLLEHLLSSLEFIITVFLKGYSAQCTKHTNFCESGLWFSNQDFKTRLESRTQITICAKFVTLYLVRDMFENGKRRPQQMEERDYVLFSWFLALKHPLSLQSTVWHY